MKPLTQTNDQIIRLLGDGKTIKEVASELKMKARTVKDRIETMRKAYHCVNTVQLVVTILSLNIENE